MEWKCDCDSEWNPISEWQADWGPKPDGLFMSWTSIPISPRNAPVLRFFLQSSEVAGSWFTPCAICPVKLLSVVPAGICMSVRWHSAAPQLLRLLCQLLIYAFVSLSLVLYLGIHCLVCGLWWGGWYGMAKKEQKGSAVQIPGLPAHNNEVQPQERNAEKTIANGAH